MMLEYSYYSVISPEGCASILWKDAARAADAAEALNLRADQLLKLGLINQVIPEPLGGAHRNPKEMAQKIKIELVKQLTKLKAKPINAILDARYKKYMDIGK
jgi:acetyl-CoA carboxylase carboxyl transferase subunit alpha